MIIFVVKIAFKYKLCFNPFFNKVRVTKSRRLRWAGHVVRIEEGRSAFKILKGKPKERDL